jgi:hypothetical protein
MGSMKEIGHRRLVQHLAWQLPWYVITHILGLKLIYNQVEHILMLWSSGNLTIEIVQEAKDTKRVIKLPVMINPVTGRQSVQYSCSAKSAGANRLDRSSSRQKIGDEAFEKIMDEAKEFAQVIHSRDEANNDVNSKDSCANLSDGGLSVMTADLDM